MREEKKIRIKKPIRSSNQNLSFGKIQKNLDLLDKTVKKIENKYKNFGFFDSKEEEFFKENELKDIVLELVNKENITGKLVGIDKFRICIDVEGIKKYFFKHAILCYYPN